MKKAKPVPAAPRLRPFGRKWLYFNGLTFFHPRTAPRPRLSVSSRLIDPATLRCPTLRHRSASRDCRHPHRSSADRTFFFTDRRPPADMGLTRLHDGEVEGGIAHAQPPWQGRAV